MPIVGDIKAILADMLEVVRTRESLGKRRAVWSKWHRQILQWQKDKPLYQRRRRREPQRHLRRFGDRGAPQADQGRLHRRHRRRTVRRIWWRGLFPFELPRSLLTCRAAARWAMGCRLESGPSSPLPTVRSWWSRATADPDEHPGAGHRRAVQRRYQSGDHQPLPGDGASVAGEVLPRRYAYSAMSVPDFVLLAQAYNARLQNRRTPRNWPPQ